MGAQLLSELKLHCRIDGDADDSKLTMLYAAAVEEMSGAGIADTGTDLWKLIAFEIVRCWYDNVPRSEALQRAINQGKLCGETAGIL